MFEFFKRFFCSSNFGGLLWRFVIYIYILFNGDLVMFFYGFYHNGQWSLISCDFHFFVFFLGPIRKDLLIFCYGFSTPRANPRTGTARSTMTTTRMRTPSTQVGAWVDRFFWEDGGSIFVWL